MPVDDVALLRRRQTVLAELRTVTADQLARRWDTLAGYDETFQGRWVELTGPVIVAAQNRAVSVQIAYLRRLLDDTFDYDRDGILAAAAIDTVQPFYAFGHAISSGVEFDEARMAGRARAEQVGQSAVQWASRAANTATGGDERIVGWRRTLAGQACEWCQVVATQRYRTAESASFGHLRCSCGVDPIIGDRDPGQVINEEALAELQRSGAVGRASESKDRRREVARTGG